MAKAFDGRLKPTNIFPLLKAVYRFLLCSINHPQPYNQKCDNIFKKFKERKMIERQLCQLYSVSGNNDMGGRAENSQGQDQGEGEKHDQAKSENHRRNLF